MGAGPPNGKPNGGARMADILLVHGAWHGGWCWRRVAEPLRRAGHNVIAPSLTGVGDRVHLAHPGIDLELHIADLVQVMEAEELSDVVLVGHSYGGMLITGLADRMPERVRSLVYVDAFVPNDGECVMQLLGPNRRAMFEALPPDVWRLPPIEAAAFGVATEANRAWVDRRCVPLPRRCFTQPIRLAGDWMRVPGKTYVLASAYERSPFQLYAAKLKSDPAWRVIPIDCGHEIMVDRPNELATAIDDAV